MIKRTLKKTWFYVAIAILLFTVLYFISNPTSYWNKSIFLVNIVYVLFSCALLIILYKFIRFFVNESKFIKKNFKYVFFIASIISMIGFGSYYTFFIEKYVVPKPTHCEYTDMYGYLIEIKDSNLYRDIFDDDNFNNHLFYDTCNVTLVDSKYNDNNQLIELTLKYTSNFPLYLPDWTLVREYENEKLISSTYDISGYRFPELPDIPFSTREYNSKWIDLPQVDSDFKRVYDYEYQENSISIIRTDYYKFNDIILAKASNGVKYKFYEDRVEKSIINTTNFLMTDDLIDNTSFREKYKEQKIRKMTKMTIDNINSELDYLHNFVDGKGDLYKEWVADTYYLVKDTSSIYYGYYMADYFDTKVYFKDVFYPYSFIGDKYSIEYNFNNGYLESCSNKYTYKNEVITNKSTFDYITSDDGKIKYINEYYNDNLVQRHVINDWGPITQVETYSLEKDEPGFNDQSVYREYYDNLGVFNPSHGHYIEMDGHYIIIGYDRNGYNDFNDYNTRYKYIIKPVKIKP